MNPSLFSSALGRCGGGSCGTVAPHDELVSRCCERVDVRGCDWLPPASLARASPVLVFRGVGTEPGLVLPGPTALMRASILSCRLLTVVSSLLTVE